MDCDTSNNCDSQKVPMSEDTHDSSISQSEKYHVTPNLKSQKEEEKTEEAKVNLGITFPEYPKQGVIGDSDPDWLDVFHSSRKIKLERNQNFRKQKFDFHETYEKQVDCNDRVIFKATPIPGLNNLWRELNRGLKISEVYDIDPNLPIRFKSPELLHGYGCEKDEHPLFKTTSSSYGQFPPTIHDVPHQYHGLKNTFTTHLARTGMPKNRSLNI